MKIAITGASGPFGSGVTRALVEVMLLTPTWEIEGAVVSELATICTDRCPSDSPGLAARSSTQRAVSER